MNWSQLLIAAGIGTIAQLAMVIAGHGNDFIKNRVFAVGGMVVSLVAGLLYVLFAGGDWLPALLGGAIAGGVPALIGIALSVRMGDVPPSVLGFGTLASTVTGVVGAAIGKLLV